MDRRKLEIEKLKEKLIPFLVGVTIFVLTLTIFRSTVVNLVNLWVENQRQQEKLAALRRKTQLLQSLDKEEVMERALKLEEVFPSEKPVLNLLASLMQLSRRERVKFGGIGLNPGKIRQTKEKKKGTENEQGPVAVKNELQEFMISFSIEGKLRQIISFISQLEKTAPLMKIEDVSLSLEGPQASLGVKVYYQAFPEYLGKIEQPVPLLSEKEKEILEEIALYRKIEPIKATALVGKANLFSLP